MGKISKFRKQNWKNLTFLFAAAIAWSIPSVCVGYVPPGGQILGFMSSNFSTFKSMVLVQTISMAGRERESAEPEEIQVKMWLKAPGFFHCEVMSNTGNAAYNKSGVDVGLGVYGIYHLLFMSRDAHLQADLLSHMGIDMNSVSLERHRESIVYRIGSPGEKRPVFFLEKDRFLPLEIAFCSRQHGVPSIISIRFDDYRKLERGWYPFRVNYFRDGEPFGTITVTSLEVNPSISTTLSPISLDDILPEETCAGREVSPQEERIDNIIRSLKQKYQ